MKSQRDFSHKSCEVWNFEERHFTEQQSNP